MVNLLKTKAVYRPKGAPSWVQKNFGNPYIFRTGNHSTKATGKFIRRLQFKNEGTDPEAVPSSLFWSKPLLANQHSDSRLNFQAGPHCAQKHKPRLAGTNGLRGEVGF
jgi:hypothetical protein